MLILMHLNGIDGISTQRSVMLSVFTLDFGFIVCSREYTREYSVEQVFGSELKRCQKLLIVIHEISSQLDD